MKFTDNLQALLAFFLEAEKWLNRANIILGAVAFCLWLLAKKLQTRNAAYQDPEDPDDDPSIATCRTKSDLNQLFSIKLWFPLFPIAWLLALP